MGLSEKLFEFLKNHIRIINWKRIEKQFIIMKNNPKSIFLSKGNNIPKRTQMLPRILPIYLIEYKHEIPFILNISKSEGIIVV